MSRWRIPIGIVVVLVLALGTMGAVSGQSTGDDTAAAGREELDPPQGNPIDPCYRKRLRMDGLTKVLVPDFCLQSMCRINLRWEGDPIGALSNGLAWGADYVQFKGGKWTAGPAVSIAGWSNVPTGGGDNGDGAQVMMFAGQTADGSGIYLYDDYPGYETGAGRFTLEMDNTSDAKDAIKWVEFWSCSYGVPTVPADQ
jgi:hypothetical protein